jgi:hypothetical protein
VSCAGIVEFNGKNAKRKFKSETEFLTAEPASWNDKTGRVLSRLFARLCAALSLRCFYQAVKPKEKK